MALEAMLCPQDRSYPFDSNYKEASSPYSPSSWGYNDNSVPGNITVLQAANDYSYTASTTTHGQNDHNHHQVLDLHLKWDSCHYSSSPNISVMQQQAMGDHRHHHHQYWEPNVSSSSPDEAASTLDEVLLPARVKYLPSEGAASVARRKRKRTKTAKNKEEIESQRITHIAVERNRRKQMNEYVAALRSLIPSTYVQRGDQASIIGGAINFVKELEQMLQNTEAHKKNENHKKDNTTSSDVSSDTDNTPFAEFFTFPQYSTQATPAKTTAAGEKPIAAHSRWAAVADIEVTMVDSYANLKILSKKRPRQLLKMVAGLQGLRLSVLHLNLTTVDQMVLHSISVKVEEGCQLNTVDEIAAAVNQMIHSIEEDAAFHLY